MFIHSCDTFFVCKCTYIYTFFFQNKRYSYWTEETFIVCLSVYYPLYIGWPSVQVLKFMHSSEKKSNFDSYFVTFTFPKVWRFYDTKDKDCMLYTLRVMNWGRVFPIKITNIGVKFLEQMRVQSYVIYISVSSEAIARLGNSKIKVGSSTINKASVPISSQ